MVEWEVNVRRSRQQQGAMHVNTYAQLQGIGRAAAKHEAIVTGSSRAQLGMNCLEHCRILLTSARRRGRAASALHHLRTMRVG